MKLTKKQQEALDACVALFEDAYPLGRLPEDQRAAIVEGIRLAASAAWWYGYEAADQQSGDMWRGKKRIRYAINQFDGSSINSDGAERLDVQS